MSRKAMKHLEVTVEFLLIAFLIPMIFFMPAVFAWKEKIQPLYSESYSNPDSFAYAFGAIIYILFFILVTRWLITPPKDM